MPATVGSWPELAQEPFGGTLERLATDDRRHGDDAVAAPRQRRIDARQGAQRLDRYERIGRGDDDGGGVLDGRQHRSRRRGARRVDPHVTHRDVMMQADEVVLERQRLDHLRG